MPAGTSGGILVFARAPERGAVKTRLARTLGADAALELHRAFLTDGLRAAREAGARVLLAHTTSADFAEAALADVRFEQRGADFHTRLDAALAEARRRLGPEPLLVVGADTPHLAPTALRHALERLERVPAVVGPSQGGGFHLVGFSGAPPPLAEAFAAPNECARLARLLRRRGLAFELLPALFDVDLPRDLVELVLLLELWRAAGGPWRPAATEAALERLGIAVAEVGADGKGGTRAFQLVVRGAVQPEE